MLGASPKEAAASTSAASKTRAHGRVVGTVFTAGEPPELTPREELFLTRINRALLYAALGAALIALERFFSGDSR